MVRALGVDTEMQAHETIYALYAHKRLHTEMEPLSEYAEVTTEDDVHLKAVFKDGTEVDFTIPAIYPNV